MDNTQKHTQPLIESLDEAKKEPDATNTQDVANESRHDPVQISHSNATPVRPTFSTGASTTPVVNQQSEYNQATTLYNQPADLNPQMSSNADIPANTDSSHDVHNDTSASVQNQQTVSSDGRESVSKQSSRSSAYSRIFFLIICAIIGALLLLVLLGIFSPQYFLTIVNVLWLLLLIFIIVFIFLGVLVVVGLKEDVTKILDIFIEGSLQFIDVANFFKKLASEFKRKLQELLIFLTPLFAIAITTAIYFGLIYLYKYIGKNYDVTLLTVILTAVIISIFGFINSPRAPKQEIKSSWFDTFKSKLGANFRDASEIMIFVFFITMDSERLFFLPEELNVLLRAQVGDYDLMHRGISPDHIVTTLSIIGITILIEVLRKGIKMFYVAIDYYRDATAKLGPRVTPSPTGGLNVEKKYSRADILKEAIRVSYENTKDDFARFMAYTTVLIIVFVFFPRLKLLAMLVTSVTMLLLDIIITDRLKYEGSDEDLISKLMGKISPGMRTKKE